jgi:hypothetical protein
MLISLNLLNKLIKEEIGRSYHTKDNKPITYKDFSDYLIQINGDNINGFYLTVYRDKEKIFPTSLFKNREEAELRSRVVIDQDRVSKMNKGSF